MDKDHLSYLISRKYEIRYVTILVRLNLKMAKLFIFFVFVGSLNGGSLEGKPRKENSFV